MQRPSAGHDRQDAARLSCSAARLSAASMSGMTGLLSVCCCRNMRGDAARRACPDMILVQVPTAHGKADLTIYREAGKQVGWRTGDVTQRARTGAHCAWEGRFDHLSRGRQAGGLAHWRCDAKGAKWCP